MNPSGQYFLNGKDLWSVFGVSILKGGTNDFLKFPDAKDTITHDWMDSNGTDVNLNRVFLQSKSITMPCVMVAKSEEEWKTKYKRFFSELTLPGLKRFEIKEFSDSYYIYYKACENFIRYTRIQNVNKIVVTFTITVIEQEPKFDNSNIFIITEDGKFLIT